MHLATVPSHARGLSEQAIKYDRIAKCPANEAMCSALHPSREANLTSAPTFTNSLTSSRLPSRTDLWSGVKPSLSKTLTFTSWPRSPSESNLSSSFVSPDLRIWSICFVDELSIVGLETATLAAGDILLDVSGRRSTLYLSRGTNQVNVIQPVL